MGSRAASQLRPVSQLLAVIVPLIGWSAADFQPGLVTYWYRSGLRRIGRTRLWRRPTWLAPNDDGRHRAAHQGWCKVVYTMRPTR